MRINKIKKRKYIITLIVLFVIGVLLFSFGFKECKTVKYAYNEDNSIDYKVYLKKNNFFEKPYIEKGKTYITSLIDYIDTDFNYKINFDNQVSGLISYTLNAEIKADKDNNDVGNYWTKKYVLVKKTENEVNGENSHEINLQEKIKYNKYNDLLNDFIKEYGLQADSTLKVYLSVTGNVTVDNTNENMDINSEISLTVPLSKLAIEGKIDTKSNNNQKEIIKKVDEIKPYRTFFRVLFVIIALLFIHNFIQFIRFLLVMNKNLSYRDTIKKINADYEDIMTKVKTINISDFTVIEVEEFDDLVNIYNSIREPINFLYGNNESKFFIIKDNSCYMYTIKKEDYRA